MEDRPRRGRGQLLRGKPSGAALTAPTGWRSSVREAGIPPGVVNIVHGRGAGAGRALTSHPDVPLISFTGGTLTGADVMAAAGPLFKKVSLELGGKNPNIVFADADLEEAVATSIPSSFANQGEICLCGSRIFVERTIYDEFLQRFLDRTKRLKVEDPQDRPRTWGR
jgi:aminomuconate-semialdehyde/2-hydroxymuconate-6-semialdehyde dehydrogenase